MKKYISILRGINVSGHRKIEMAGLKALFEELQFKDVSTYIQSGNVIFKSDNNWLDKDLVKKIEEAILNRYKFEVPVIVRSADEMQQILAKNPFLKRSNINLEKLHVTLLSDTPDSTLAEAVENTSFPPDECKIVDKEVFLYCPDTYGETKLSNAFFEKKLKLTATTRNWKTVNKLVELANKTA